MTPTIIVYIKYCKYCSWHFDNNIIMMMTLYYQGLIDYDNPNNMTKLSKFKLKGTKVQSFIWKGAKGQTCKLKGAKVQSYT